MNIKTCNLIINFNLRYLEEFKNIKNYETREPSQYSINTVDNEIIFKKDNLVKTTDLYKLYLDNGILYQENYINKILVGTLKYNNKDIDLYLYNDNHYYEYVLSQYAYVYLIEHYTEYVYIHSSSIKYNDKVILLLARSGVGKSTLRNTFLTTTDSVCINDDKNIIGLVNDELHVFNSIYAGKEYISTNTCGTLSALVFLEQGQANKLIPINGIEVLKRILGQVKLANNKNKDSWNEILDKLLETKAYVYENIISNHTATDLIHFLEGYNCENKK